MLAFYLKNSLNKCNINPRAIHGFQSKTIISCFSKCCRSKFDFSTIKIYLLSHLNLIQHHSVLKKYEFNRQVLPLQYSLEIFKKINFTVTIFT